MMGRIKEAGIHRGNAYWLPDISLSQLTISERCFVIREVYKNRMPHILKNKRINPYWMPWEQLFTPIETNVWNDIRMLGLPFYPQVPVGRFFIDFADPNMRIGIEADGKKWHQDKQKDADRDRELRLMGWEIIRIPGSKTFKGYEDYYQEREDKCECHHYGGEDRLCDYCEEEERKFKTESSTGILKTLFENRYLNHRQSNRPPTDAEIEDYLQHDLY